MSDRPFGVASASSQESLDVVVWSKTAPAMEVPHRIELVRSVRMPRDDLVTSAFVIAHDDSGRLAMTYVDLPNRGWDIPGGHLDSGESAAMAAARELAEETGIRLSPQSLQISGWTRITLEERPASYRYPYPTSYMVFFNARVDSGGELAPQSGTECTAARWMTATEVRELVRAPDWLPLTETLAQRMP